MNDHVLKLELENVRHKPPATKQVLKTNLLINEVDTLKETSRFGVTPVRVIDHSQMDEKSDHSSISHIPHNNPNQPYLEGHNISYNKISDKAYDYDGTLSLSLNGKNDSQYYIQDSGAQASYGYQDIKYKRKTRKRVANYETQENNEYDSSIFETASRNSKGSYRIEFLMHKAFTPIVPVNTYGNDISKISWNKNNLYDNISYSDMTESAFRGRNSELVKKNLTDKIVKNKKILTLSNKGITIRSKQNFIVRDYFTILIFIVSSAAKTHRWKHDI